MSRIGKLPVNLPEGVTVTINGDNLVSVKGPLGELTQAVNSDIDVQIEDSRVVLTRKSETKECRSLHGLYRSLINNMEGVSKGYSLKLEFVGVGYRAEAKGQILEMSLGFSHDIHLKVAPEVKVEAETLRRANPIVTLTSCDKQLVGQVAAKIRTFRKPEPFKGKGIKFVGEQLRRKAGKSASA